MKAYRIKYYIPTERVSRSKKILATDALNARAIFMAQAKNSGSSAIVKGVQEDHCKNCGK